MQGIELVCFQIISAVGTARSLYIEAIQAAKAGNFQDAEAKIEEGNIAFNQGHEVHAKLVQQEAGGEKIDYCLLLLHAEDLQISAESFGILAQEFIDVYKVIYKLNKETKNA